MTQTNLTRPTGRPNSWTTVNVSVKYLANDVTVEGGTDTAAEDDSETEEM